MQASRQQILIPMLTYAKIKAVAVSEDGRGLGIGTALLEQCAQVYRQLDYTLLFGEFGTERGLGPYYSKSGFKVLRPGQVVDVGSLLTDIPLHLGAAPGLTFFQRRLPHR